MTSALKNAVLRKRHTYITISEVFQPIFDCTFFIGQQLLESDRANHFPALTFFFSSYVPTSFQRALPFSLAVLSYFLAAYFVCLQAELKWKPSANTSEATEKHPHRRQWTGSFVYRSGGRSIFMLSFWALTTVAAFLTMALDLKAAPSTWLLA